MKFHARSFGILLLFCFASISAAFADDDAVLMAQLAQLKKNCEQYQAEAKRKAEQLKSAAAKADLPPQKKQQVEHELQSLNTAIAQTDAFLTQPMPATKDAQESYLKSAYVAVAAARQYEAAVAKDIGISPTSHLEGVLSQLGDAQDFKTRYGAFDWQHAIKDGNLLAPVAQGPNNNFFGVPSAGSTPQISTTYLPTTVDAATNISNHDHGVGGGIMLEGNAGLRFSSVEYDGGVNALVLNGDVVYLVKIPPWSLATMCREIGTDRNSLFGVSETGTDGLVFGDKPQIYKGSDLAYELMLADKFLGDVIFARPYAWTQGYQFPTGTAPAEARVRIDMLVRFAFGDFQFAVNDGQLSPVSSSLEVRMMPVSKVSSPTGQMLPNYNAMDEGWTPPDAFLANVRILNDHVDYFRRELLISDVFAAGETAAVLRSLKESGQDLNALADKIDGGAR
jgi:hypothetical protein